MVPAPPGAADRGLANPARTGR